MTHVVYEMEPIGVDGALEAVASHPYCSEACQGRHNIPAPFKLGEENSSFEGLVCETCGKPADAPAPMADERETAQWFMSNGISADDAKKLLAAEVPNAEKTCYKFGSLAAWQPLPQAAKDALRRELARVRAESERYEREVLKRCDGEHGEPACADPRCWHVDPAQLSPAEPEPPRYADSRLAPDAAHYNRTYRPSLHEAVAAREEITATGANAGPISGQGQSFYFDWTPAQLSPAPGTFVDITPETPEEKLKAELAALDALKTATAAVADAAEQYVRDYDQGAGITAWKDLRDAIKARRAKQDALRAMASRSPQSDRAKIDPNNTTKTGPDGLFPALS